MGCHGSKMRSGADGDFAPVSAPASTSKPALEGRVRAPARQRVGVYNADVGRGDGIADVGPTIASLLAEHADSLAELRVLAAGVEGYERTKHDDLYLLRYLLSHKLQPRAAVKAFASGLAWRRANGIDAIAQVVKEAGFVDGVHSQFPQYGKINPRLPMHFSGLADGQPTVYFSVRELKLAELMREITVADYVLYSQYLNEMVHQATDAASRRTGRIVKLVRLIDATGVGWHTLNMKYFSAVTAAARGSEDAYPQLLGYFFMCNAGRMARTFWENAARPLLPSRMVEKSALLEPLTSEADLQRLLVWVPLAKLPAQLGGGKV
ncbi:hypothetical protein T492DRAFT_951903 [Pavlovales sp. CCMP2436]|nr:hypothetical protein T492DRAFT_951903 [Pavlovales sp. CCMP2436]